jgi:hydrogenase maturation protein HypF
VSIEAPAAGRRRTRARVQGTVQGVGFRPYVYRLAGELGLGGFVLNDAQGVLLEVEGGAAAVAAFLSRLEPEAPPLAVLERVSAEDREPQGEHRFAILESPRDGVADAPVTPDSATCADCLRELLDPDDRRFRYPFTNCTNCGPRFTIVRGIPYDRPYTTMAAFRMCARCQAEYEDPVDRRFHAQPNACPECGPSVSLLTPAGEPAALGSHRDAVQAAAAALRDGAVLALKGIGGYHLACRADDEATVARLRARKHREDKPFALMAGTLKDAAGHVVLGDRERELLSATERPIVLAPRRREAPVADAVAPGSPELGVMLPYSPLHHLLLADYSDHSDGSGASPEPGVALVMTSGNVSDEPIAFGDQDALERLAPIADLLLVHDRPIQTRTDDSVVRVVAAPAGPRPVMLRRSRGYVPAGLPLPGAGTPRHVLACGAELKNTFCVAKGGRAWVSHHIGDLKNYETLRSFTDGIERFERLFAVAPEVVAHDLHPEYLSSKYAFEREGVELVGVQHHHAHLAACLAEHGEPGSAIGAIYDGTGYGTDGTVWGGELLYGDLDDFRRVGTLTPVRLPGGERAIREPWRMACAWLAAAGAGGEGGGGAPAIPPALVGRVAERSWAAIAELARTGLASPQTSSMGRLFDAVAALCGIRPEVNYEGQAAIELEALCDPGEVGRYPIGLEAGALDEGPGALVIDPRETILAVSADLAAGVPASRVASRFHATIAAVTVEACARAAAGVGTDVVVLSGGVFQNRRLLEAVAQGLGEAGLRGLHPQRLPANDGGIAFGQAAVAARRMQSR